MKNVHASRSVPSSRRARATLSFGPWLLLGLAACGGGGTTLVSSGTAGGVILHPEPGLGSRTLVVDANLSGRANPLRIQTLAWGRIAKIRDALGELQQTDMVIGEDIRTDNVDYQLDVNPITEETTVTILHPFTASAIVGGIETSPYQRAFRRLDQNLTPIQDKSLETNELPPYTLVPRNSAIVLRFNDLLDVSTINNSTIKLLTGTPPTAPFEARILPDINHGAVLDRDGNGQGEFYTTRVIIDTTVSTFEAHNSGTTLAVNSLGLPASTAVNQANVGVRIPTQIDASLSQFALLRNLAGNALSFNGNGSNDASSSTEDVVRAMRSGGATAITGDVNNGFLVDNIPPRLVGTMPVQLGVSTQHPNGGQTTTLAFNFISCRMKLKSGDVLQQPGLLCEGQSGTLSAEIVEVADDIDDGQLDGLYRVHYRVIDPALCDRTLSAGPCQLTTLYDPVENAGREACFVRFPSISQPPDQGVSTDSPIILRFSEPMDPTRMTPFDNFTVTRTDVNPTGNDFIVGSITSTGDLKEFRFSPALPLRHTSGTAEQYFVNLASGATGPLDLAGNTLAATLPSVPFRVNATQATQSNAGIVVRFSSDDEFTTNNGADRPEWRGQFLFDGARGLIKPRTVVHFNGNADRSQPVPSIMPIFAAGVQTPLSPLGSKLQTLWRYCDVGFGLLDETFFNVDVEGLAWAPVGGSAVADQYDAFEMYLGHSKHLPDESVDAFLLPNFPASGLEVTYNNNWNDLTNDPPFKVHDRSRGYTVNPADRYQAESGTRLMPWPWNRGLAIADKRFYTWRDTALQTKGGPFDSPGAELLIVIRTLGLNVAQGVPFPTSQVPTIGLPLLMEFRCYPDSGALGLNSFDISLGNLNSAQPNFRAFSTGGNQNGTTVVKNPDLQPTATGGFNPTSVPPGLPTLGVDNSFYIGQMNLVTRVSRAHSIWFDTGAGSVPQFSTPVIEPRAEDQPLGTQVVLAFRGTSSITVTPTQPNVLNDARTVDPYGEPRPANWPPAGGTVSYPGADNRWKNSIGLVSGQRYFQVRVTFIANIETSQTAELSALGFAYRL
ncbi:MAG: Ig-like domain-containing protein [Planctomycetes bacterium]|nr:Ig-like domain-containing protein [Planctomycetota bacterium]